VQFRVLGTVEVLADDGRVLTLRRRQERCLLAALLLEAGHTVPVERLCILLWDGEPPERARATIRTYVARIRSLLVAAGADRHGVALVASRGGYLLSIPPDTLDAQRFRTLARQAAEEDDIVVRDRLYQEALALWRGPALDNVATDEVRRRLSADLEELRLHAMDEALATGLDLGRDQEVLPKLARFDAEHPVRERLVELHMLALYRAGRTTEALQVYDSVRGHLADKLGLDPGPVLQQLHQAILRGEPLQPGRPSPPSPRRYADVTPAQLPADLATFVGRDASLRYLDSLLSPSTMAIAVIAGTAGVGKTTLAVHWAHQCRDRFPDGQLYLNLRGFDADADVMTPTAAIRGLLDALGVPAGRIPTGLPAQAGLYRSLLAGKRVLILLDNARHTDQVRPLLPGTPGCLVLVTSRNQLTGLAAIDGASPVILDLLTPQEARQFLAARIGAGRVEAEPGAVADIIRFCARLPLALAIIAAHAGASPDLPLALLAAELADIRSRLDTLHGDDTPTDVRAVFSWSYTSLSPDAALLFRLLSLHNGSTITTAAAASLTSRPVNQVKPVLVELVRAHLLTIGTAGRFAFHDLLRVYATELMESHETEAQRKEALDRLYDHLLHTAHAASGLLQPHRDPIVVGRPGPGVTVEPLANYDEARAWLTIEQPALVAGVRSLAEAGSYPHAWQLAWSVENYLDWWGNWDDLAATQQIALDAARRLNDRPGQARAHRGLARAHTRLKYFDEAYTDLRQALDLHNELGDAIGEVDTHHNLAHMFEQWDRPHEALHYAEQALVLAEKAGDSSRRARALNAIGWNNALLGNHRQAAALCGQALLLYRQLGNRKGEAATWHSIGYAYHHLGQHARAVNCFRRAIDVHREIGDRHHEAAILALLGDTRSAMGNHEAARDAWHQALSIYEELDESEAARIRTRLG
jgi:DNA-binding SARP family transcriptional activator/tetratricopeptide (TPR) repeat protein